MAKFQPGQSGNPAGRPKGTPNRTTQTIKDAILRAFDEEDFIEWVKENKSAFYTQVLTRLLPKEIKEQEQLVVLIRDMTKDRLTEKDMDKQIEQD